MRRNRGLAGGSLRDLADRVRAHLTIPDVLEAADRDTGDGINAECPFCQHHRPKFGYGWSNGERFHCFHCDARGDVIDLIRHLKQCEFPTALKYATRLAGLDSKDEADIAAVLDERQREAAEMKAAMRRRTKADSPEAAKARTRWDALVLQRRANAAAGRTYLASRGLQRLFDLFGDPRNQDWGPDPYVQDLVQFDADGSLSIPIWSFDSAETFGYRPSHIINVATRFARPRETDDGSKQNTSVLRGCSTDGMFGGYFSTPDIGYVLVEGIADYLTAVLFFEFRNAVPDRRGQGIYMHTRGRPRLPRRRRPQRRRAAQGR